MKKLLIAAALFATLPAAAKIGVKDRPYAYAQHIMKCVDGKEYRITTNCPIKSWRNHSNPQYRKWYEEDGGDKVLKRIDPATYKECWPQGFRDDQFVEWEKKDLRRRTIQMALGSACIAGATCIFSRRLADHIVIQAIYLLWGHEKTIHDLISGIRRTA